MFSEVQQPGIGTFRVPAHPAVFSALQRSPARPAPTLGQHTEEILADVAGCTGTEIAKLFDAGVVQSPTFAKPRNAA